MKTQKLVSSLMHNISCERNDQMGVLDILQMHKVINIFAFHALYIIAWVINFVSLKMGMVCGIDHAVICGAGSQDSFMIQFAKELNNICDCKHVSWMRQFANIFFCRSDSFPAIVLQYKSVLVFYYKKMSLKTESLSNPALVPSVLVNFAFK